MKRYQLWKSDFFFWIQLLWTSLSLFRWDHPNLVQKQIVSGKRNPTCLSCKSVRWLGWIVAELQVLTSSNRQTSSSSYQDAYSMCPSHTSQTTSQRRRLVVLLDALRSPNNEENRGNWHKHDSLQRCSSFCKVLPLQRLPHRWAPSIRLCDQKRQPYPLPSSLIGTVEAVDHNRWADS